ncbi:hypothetical protein G9A89_019434 [Geosiphon pyriformis]|nr:hypothetical protein G9A89_019434 [Geosiphon pyriformis]
MDYFFIFRFPKKHFEAHNKNNLDFIELNLLPSCLICFPIENQFSRQFQDFWNWFLNKHSAETYTAYTTYYFDQAYFEDNFKEKNNSINQLLYSTTFEQQPSDSEYLNHQIHIWIAAHQATETLFETEEESYQTAFVLTFYPTNQTYLHKQLLLNQWLITSYIQTVLGRRNNTPLLLFRDNTQDPIEWLDDFERAAIANANAQHQIIRWTPTNAGKENTSFTTQFKTKFRTPILISKWHMELERRTQGPREVVTKYAKAIRKLIKCVDFKRNWTKEQKIYFFTKRLRTDLSYAFWPLLALKNNSTIDMAIELAQKIKDNQKMHLGFTLPVFAPVPAMALALQMAAASFAAQTQDPNKQLIDRLTANLAQLLEPLVQAVKENQQSQRPRFESHFN